MDWSFARSFENFFEDMQHRVSKLPAEQRDAILARIAQLSWDDLFLLVKRIRKWCEMLATAGQAEFGYDGFARNSLQKSRNPIWQNYKVSISGLVCLRPFV